MTKPAKNVAASVRRRLQDHALSAGRPFQEVLEYFAMERSLYRLAISPHADRFVLKGALMFVAWGAHGFRPTKDIDLLARMDNDPEAMGSIIHEVCRLDAQPDGMVFDPASVRAKVIKEGADYEGVRVTFRGTLENARVAMQIDVGFGDVVVPAPVETTYPVILDLPAPRLYGYSRETAIAETLEAMVRLGQLNSRMKDFFDIWLLLRRFEFDGKVLASAIGRTFANRGTSLVPEPLALTLAFADDRTKQAQWAGFLRKSRTTTAQERLAEVIDEIGRFLSPVVAAISRSESFDRLWKPGGPWQLI